MYKVIKYFTDLQDNGHPYHVGDVYPREGLSVSEARIAELSGSKNKQGVALIEKVAEKAKEEKVAVAEEVAMNPPEIAEEKVEEVPKEAITKDAKADDKPKAKRGRRTTNK